MHEHSRYSWIALRERFIAENSFIMWLKWQFVFIPSILLVGHVNIYFPCRIVIGPTHGYAIKLKSCAKLDLYNVHIAIDSGLLKCNEIRKYQVHLAYVTWQQTIYWNPTCLKFSCSLSFFSRSRCEGFIGNEPKCLRKFSLVLPCQFCFSLSK